MTVYEFVEDQIRNNPKFHMSFAEKIIALQAGYYLGQTLLEKGITDPILYKDLIFSCIKDTNEIITEEQFIVAAMRAAEYMKNEK